MSERTNVQCDKMINFNTLAKNATTTELVHSEFNFDFSSSCFDWDSITILLMDVSNFVKMYVCEGEREGEKEKNHTQQ